MVSGTGAVPTDNVTLLSTKESRWLRMYSLTWGYSRRLRAIRVSMVLKSTPTSSPAQLWRQALQEHPLHMGLFFVREERYVPCHHCNSNDCFQAMRLPIMCSQRFRQGEKGFRNFDSRACLLRRGRNP